jgi:hypothetical protein
MNQVPHPRNWQTAASMVIDATFDLAKSAAVAAVFSSCEKANVEQKIPSNKANLFVFITMYLLIT